jgi:hypothetical protein
MPFVKDFSSLIARSEFSLEVPKWKPLTIEYGYEYINEVLAFYWRVKGTTHTFWAFYHQVAQDANGKQDEHIKTILETFRTDYLGWLFSGLTESWMREYHEQYKNFIEL